MYDIVVVGGGHAGVEACWSAARQEKRVLLITQNVDRIGDMSCNPAIGGLAKSHLVKEMDILGALMPFAADSTAIQFKTLNSSKGPAVWALRVQSDKKKYSAFVRQKLEDSKYIDIVQDEVVDLIIKDHVACGIECELNGLIFAKAVIICSGTFLNGLIHIGEKQVKSGRLGENSSKKLAERLHQVGFVRERLKTGTPPRIAASSIDFSKLEKHGSDKNINLFSFHSKDIKLPQIPCYITYTNDETHCIVRSNLQKTALFSGSISGIGPRYCPSIEDKVHRFSDKSQHRIFIEPEGLETQEYYLNGISTSLPLELQKKMLTSIAGLENAHIVRPAYAIEYDYFPSHQIRMTLETKKIKNLYFAGQINGTSGYEEAAAQGLIAGINASLKISGKEPLILRRDQAYIGVLIDDLITKEIKEPYRMFTSLAEFRLLLRHDNADMRLLDVAIKFKLLSSIEISILKNRVAKIQEACLIIEDLKISLRDVNLVLSSLNLPLAKQGMNLGRLIKRPQTNICTIREVLSLSELGQFNDFQLLQAETIIRYQGYIDREQERINKSYKKFAVSLPQNFNYNKISGLKIEAIEKLNRVQPLDLAQASRIAGISPADISVLMVNLKKIGLI